MDDAREPRIEDCDVVALLRAARYSLRRKEELDRAWLAHGLCPAAATEWIRSGVFDPQCAALLRAAGVAPGEIARDQVEGFPLGYAFAVGRVSLGQVVERVAPRRSEVP